MIIRQATYSDLHGIASTHKTCFPHSFSTLLCSKMSLMENFYMEYMKDNPELFLVATDNTNNVIGFCMGYYCEKNDYQKKFLFNNFLKISISMFILLVKGEKKAWGKLIKRKSNKKEVVNLAINKYQHDQMGDILSICVLPEYRGKNVSGEMIEKYKSILKDHGRYVCVLTVEGNNTRGIKFYEKHQFVPYKKSLMGDITYACEL